MRTRSTIATALLATFVATVTASTANADTSPSVDWSRVLSDLDIVARKGADVLDSPRCSLAGCQTDTNATASAPERLVHTHLQTAGTDWVALDPKFSLVARDWNEAYKVAGERLALVDALRLTSSTRMVLGRVRANDARISPFAQVGLGQWRTDPYLLPLTARYTEIAAQAAGGVEIRLVGTWLIALETTMTMLYRETRNDSMPAAQIWSTTFASRVDF
ncbi:hypothetical protein BH11MYX4_BH11MYX4_09920 [soil metagenome]